MSRDDQPKMRLDPALPGSHRYHVPSVDPDQFLYSRRGPWPQPSPSHPLGQAPEIMNVPPMEQMLWNQTIGARYVQTQLGFPPVAASKAAAVMGYAGPDEARFHEVMLGGSYTRFLRRATETGNVPEQVATAAEGAEIWVMDFRAMQLVEPMAGTFVAPTRLFIRQPGDESTREVFYIEIGGRLAGRGPAPLPYEPPLYVRPVDPAWMIAKIYVMQGAAYHMLFVVHPAIHFPLDTVNAVTKTSVPHTHPIFQLLLPHTSYSLMLNHVVLDGSVSVVSDNVQGTWSSPLTGDAPNLKLLFAAGYAGWALCPKSYPQYDFLKPQLGNQSAYMRFLTAYHDRAILPFCRKVADYILGSGSDYLIGYTRLWAEYNHTHLFGFPDENEILKSPVLAQSLASFMFLASVSHGADHATFGGLVAAHEKLLRIRVPPPQRVTDNPTLVGRLFTTDDIIRAELAQAMYFVPTAIPPNLASTGYAFREPELLEASVQFQKDLRMVDAEVEVKFMPLLPSEDVPFVATIPQSIQY